MASGNFLAKYFKVQYLFIRLRSKQAAILINSSYKRLSMSLGKLTECQIQTCSIFCDSQQGLTGTRFTECAR